MEHLVCAATELVIKTCGDEYVIVFALKVFLTSVFLLKVDYFDTWGTVPRTLLKITNLTHQTTWDTSSS